MTQIIGQVNKDGHVEIGTNFFKAQRTGEGVYDVAYLDRAFDKEPVVVVTTLVDKATEASGVGLYDATAEGFTVNIKTMHEDLVDRGFNFIATDK